MEIISSPLRPSDTQEGEGCPLATVADERTLFVGVGLGSIQDAHEHVDLTRSAWECIGVLREHAKRQKSPDNKLQIIEIGHIDQVAHHVCHALEQAIEGDVVFFVCTDADIVDATWAALNAQPCPAPHTKQ